MLTQARYLFLQQKALSVLATEDMSAVETGPMSAAETGQMSAIPESSGSAWACGASQVAPAGV